ncbi:MAG: hypothetical protein JXX14_05950 [Deltaproteobacteria bacterium]|nr:hypothetical protein [Deltaproteobacteria bacterium]
MRQLKLILAVLICILLSSAVYAQSGEVSATTSGTASVSVGSDAKGTTESDETAALRLKAEIARAEAEKAKAEAEKAKAEAERARTEAESKKDAQASAAVQVPPPAPLVAAPAPPPVPQNNTVEPTTSTETSTETQPNHRGLFLRFAPGLGLGVAWARGTMDPRPGLEAITNPRHTTLTGTIGLDIGAGLSRRLALHVGTFYEKMIFRMKDPTNVVFSILGVGAGLTWYFTDLELYLTGQFRWVGMLLKFPEVSCSDYFDDTFEWYKGPGMSLTFGREWFESPTDDNATGIGIQANYYRMHGGIDKAYAFNHFSLLAVLTFTHF